MIFLKNFIKRLQNVNAVAVQQIFCPPQNYEFAWPKYSLRALINLFLFFASLAEKLGHWYYFNTANGTSQWTHPADTIFKDKVEEARKNYWVDLNSKFKQGIS